MKISLAASADWERCADLPVAAYRLVLGNSADDGSPVMPDDLWPDERRPETGRRTFFELETFVDAGR